MTIPANFIGAHKPLAAADVSAEAGLLQCTTAIIHAFSNLESSGIGYLPDGRLKLLHEARYFHLLTGGKYDRIAPNISSPVWDRSLYGAGGTHQWDRFMQAARLDYQAALKSCSIGRFQPMGANFKRCGFATVEDMWAAFCDSEAAQMKAFGSFIKTGGMQDELQSDPPDFLGLSVGYNGAGEAANGYHQKLETEFYHFVDEGEGTIPPPSGEVGRADDPQAPPLAPAPTTHLIMRELRAGMTGPDVALMQGALNTHENAGLKLDGVFGRRATLPAVIAYQKAKGLRPVDGIAGHDTLTALGLY